MNGKISTFSARLREALNLRKMTQAALSDLSGVSRPSISRYLSGAWEGKQNAVYALAKSLDVSEGWLMGYDMPMERRRQEEAAAQDMLTVRNVLPKPQTVQIPLIGTIACGTPILAEENFESYVDAPEHVHADFCLRCQGDSMINARILDGDIVFIRQQPDVDDGQIAAVLIDDDATLKRVYHNRDGGITLVAANPAYPPLVYSSSDCVDVRIMGKAVAFVSGL